jgi:hypothetical protein
MKLKTHLAVERRRRRAADQERKAKRFRTEKRRRRRGLLAEAYERSDDRNVRIARPDRRAEHLEVYTRGQVVRGVCLQSPSIPPAILDLAENESATRSFLNSARRLRFTSDSPEQPGFNGLMRVYGYHDYAKIRKITPAAALVIASHYERATRGPGADGQNIHAINVRSWDPAVRRWFEVLGIFDLLGISGQVPATEGKIDGGTLFLPVLSGERTNEDDMAALDQALLELAGFVLGEGSDPEELSTLGTHMSEAVTNVVHWAYPDGFDYEVPPLKKWWITGQAVREPREVSLVIYDQGASIPSTIMPKVDQARFTDAYRRLKTRVQRSVGRQDGRLIELALSADTSNARQSHRGNGLSEMANAVSELPGSELRIWSRNGTVVLKNGEDIQVRHRSPSIGGTLVEWRLALGDDRS